MPKLSEYELEREANIARNRALLEQLDLKQAVAGLNIPSTAAKSKAKPVQPAKRARKEKVVVEAPRRQSTRLRKDVVNPNETPAQKRKREAEAEERRAAAEQEREEAEEKARLAKRPRHNDLDLDVLLGDDEDAKAEISTLRSTFRTILEESRPKGVADNDTYAYKDDKKHKRAMEDLRERMQGLKVVSRAKVTQDRVYSAAYHPEPTKDLIFFGDKHGQLGIWDARAPAEEVADEDDEEDSKDGREGGKYWRLQVHWPASSISSISAIRFNPVDAHSVYTSSYDCTVRNVSFTSGISTEIYATDDKTLINCIDPTPDGHQMWISDAQGRLTHLDLRQDRSKARRYAMSSVKMGCVSVNPMNPNFLVTTSNNRMLQIWDCRKLSMIEPASEEFTEDLPTPPPSSPVRRNSPKKQKKVQEQEQEPQAPPDFDEDVVTEFMKSRKGKGLLRGEFKHDKSVSSAYWDPSGRHIVSTCYDDRLRIWDIDGSNFKKSDSFGSTRPFSSISHDCQTGRWLTILKAQWAPNPDVYPHFTVGNMKHSIDIYSCKGDLVTRLVDPSKITAVQAVTCSHPSIVERAASGNGSGRCVLWAPASSD